MIYWAFYFIFSILVVSFSPLRTALVKHWRLEHLMWLWNLFALEPDVTIMVYSVFLKKFNQDMAERIGNMASEEIFSIHVFLYKWAKICSLLNFVYVFLLQCELPKFGNATHQMMSRNLNITSKMSFMQAKWPIFR